MGASNDKMNPFKRVLFYTDFSSSAEFAFDFALDAVASAPDSVLYLLHVIPESEAQFWKTYLYELNNIDEKAKKDIDDKIARSYMPKVPVELDFQIEIRIGKDYIKILEFAREKNVDLIVIGQQGHGILEKALFGNVIEKITQKSEFAVLVIPHKSKP
jgi:nucleotide-binding universal stress UspA family protein